MINLLRVLQLTSNAEQAELDKALHACRHSGAQDVEGVAVDRLQGILGTSERLVHYRRVHEQYTALATALELLDIPETVDTHRWHDRLVEFVED